MPPSYRNTTANNLSLLLPAYVYYAFFPRFLYSFRTIFHTDFSLHWQSFAPDCHQKNPKPFPSPASGIPETSKTFRSDHLPYPAVHIYDKHLENIPLRYMHLPNSFYIQS